MFRFQHVVSVVQAAGEYEKMVQGVFENYLEAKSKDTYMAGVRTSLTIGSFRTTMYLNLPFSDTQ